MILQKHWGWQLKRRNRKKSETESTLEEQVLQKMEGVMFGERRVRGMSRHEQQKLALQRGRLRQAVCECVMGSIGDRIFVKEYIKEILTEQLHTGEEELDGIIPFRREYQLTVQDKFEILQYYFAASYQREWFQKMYQQLRGIEAFRACPDEISSEQVEYLYHSIRPDLDFLAKLEIVSQRIYQNLYGFSVCDYMISEDTILEGIAGGCGGRKERWQNRQRKEPYGHDMIFVMLNGRKIRLSFLSFGTEQVLSAVVKRISRNSSREQLSRKHSYLVTNLKSNARVVAVRPPVSDGWGFYVRKFQSTAPDKIEELLTDVGREYAISLLRLLVRGGMNLIITGEQASGKTTLLKSLVGFIPEEYSIRVAETVFESRLNELYPSRNIHCMQEYGKVTLQELLSFFKKTDTDVTICGEINDPETAVAMVQIAQSGGRFTLSTSHHGTTEKLLHYLRNALLSHGGFRDEQVAMEQVLEAVQVDVHLAVTADGHRYIERVTEIMREESGKVSLKELLTCRESGYILGETMCQWHAAEIKRNDPAWSREAAAVVLGKE